MTTRFRVGSATDVGQVRTNNQDSLLVIDGQLFAVADGMGGAQGGEVASALALSVLGEAIDEHTTAALVRAVNSANQAVFERANDDPDLRGMGTTLTGIALVDTDDGDRLAVINVGDSRVYRTRDGGDLEQLTEDHSLVASLVRQGRITAEEAEHHPQRNILTRALGIDEAVAIDSWEIEPVAGDRFLLCSDGLFNEVDANRTAAVLRRFEDPADAARELVRLANEGGGRDNITCVVVDVVEGGGETISSADDEEDGDEDEDPTTETQPVVADEGRVADVSPRPRRLTWRVAVFVLALLLLLGAVVGALGWYARKTYFVAVDAERVTIFKGRPGGFLWFDPTVEQPTDIAVADVPESLLDDLDAGVDQATLGDAERYVANLQDQIAQDQEPPPTTSTTTTTTTTTTSPPRAGGN
jgi:PPM family protein phosphatase